MLKPRLLTAWLTAALQHFSESTLEYLANLDQAPDPTVRKDAFASDISNAYDILFHQWLPSREAKVRPHLAAALSHPPSWQPQVPPTAWASSPVLLGGVEPSVYTCPPPCHALRMWGLVAVEVPCARFHLQVLTECLQLVSEP